MAVTVEAVQGILAGLIDPNTKKDYIASRSAKNIKVDGDKVSLDIELGYPAKSRECSPCTRSISASGVMPSFSARSMIGVPCVSSAQTYQQESTLSLACIF